jgi:hypothetical protein
LHSRHEPPQLLARKWYPAGAGEGMADRA